MALKPGCKGWPTDVCVPIFRLAECILETRADIDASNLTVPIVGHVGDGNFHLLFLIDPANEAEDLKQFQQLNDRLIERALKMGGTCTGEHGVGIGKIHYMRAEHGESVEMIRQIKQALDPLNLFKPGKLVPARFHVLEIFRAWDLGFLHFLLTLLCAQQPTLSQAFHSFC